GLQDPHRTARQGRSAEGRGFGVQGRGDTDGPSLPAGTPGRGPLVQAGFGLLGLASLLRARRPPSDPSGLRQSIGRELAQYADTLRQRGVDERLVSLGHYCLCAFIDDVVLNTPWGQDSVWRNDTLAGSMHSDVAAGEHFFDYLEQARRAPERL